MIKKITKSINLKYTGQNINLPKDLNDKIKIFWSKAIIETPTLYNGEDYAVEDVTEKENEIIMKVPKQIMLIIYMMKELELMMKNIDVFDHGVELDTYNNPKRNYLRELISKVDYNIKKFVFDFGNVLFGWDIDDIVKHYADNEKGRLELKEIIFQSNEWSMLDNGTLNYNEAKEIFKNKISKHLEGKQQNLKIF